MAANILGKKPGRIFYGWYIVVACVIITLYTGGVVNFGFTAVFDPIAKEFGWSYAQISFASSLRGLEVGLLSAGVGLLVDRWGPRRLLVIGTTLVFLGFLLLSTVQSLLMFYAAFALISLGMSACTGTVLLTAVTNWFKLKAGLATGIVASGFGLGGILVPVVTWLIDSYQWRTAMIVVGIATLVLCLPLAFVVRHKPEHYGYLPDGATGVVAADGKTVVPPAPEVNYSPKQVLKDRTFWHIAIASSCHAFVVGAIVTHIMPSLTSIHIDRSLAAMVALILPLVSIGGRLGVTWLNAWWGNRTVFVSSFIMMTVGLLIFGFLSSGMLWLLVPFIIAFSLGWGISVTSRLTLLREYYGRASFGAVIGFNSTIMMIGNVTGAPLAGWIFDKTGSYQWAWLSFGALALAGMALILTMPRPGGKTSAAQPVLVAK